MTSNLHPTQMAERFQIDRREESQHLKYDKQPDKITIGEFSLPSFQKFPFT
jgi:hypothetical protein